ncbi:MAG TPA: glycosyl hydrolase family 65 protein [Verrucomicrobiota bacterium]|nr:glycosyl hydrolase family 65 protein [Verrucomicrobiota bacterium]HQB16772.1 glycosyl hydrolase family 65 protein [Verrucomicrobiota bacterium]
MNLTQNISSYVRRLGAIGVALVMGGLSFTLCAAPPADFPRFEVPGQEAAMNQLRELFWLHYPDAGPKATLWDEWLPGAALWPAVQTGEHAEKMRRHWGETLSARIVDPEGYVATHQHASIAHQLGWPFPFWNQGRRGCGWHFSFHNTVGPNWRPHDLVKTDGWTLAGAADGGLKEDGWRIEVNRAGALITAPPWRCHTYEVPFLQLRWNATGLGASQPFIEWTTPAATNFTRERRFYFNPATANAMTYTMIPMYRHPQWTGEVAQLRIGLGNAAPGGVTLQAFFSQYDTRQNINGQNFVRGCAKYFWWTGDLNFLRANLPRMRQAIRYLMTEHQALERKVVFTDWVGHEGRSGFKRSPAGEKVIFTGQGIGNNYWDLLPFGWLDCYATVQYYDAVRTLARLERELLAHPEWNLPRGVLAFDPGMLERHAADVKATGNRLFWNNKTQRFNACIDADGNPHEYGYTFLNLEAVYYDFATPAHAQTILQWINGDRLVAGDTAQGADIYHWRFAPRASTKRNLDWYFWAWHDPESIAWGDQVQDGGAVLGFSYHDLMARLKVLGPDNAWQRLREIIRWFDDVQAAGGYRQYYDGRREGKLQGGGTAGGLGMDQEFFESVLVPQVMLDGFLGFAPRGDGFQLTPRLPADWPELSVDRVRFQNHTLRFHVRRDTMDVFTETTSDEPLRLWLPATITQVHRLGADAAVLGTVPLPAPDGEGARQFDFAGGAGLRFEWTALPPGGS